MGDEVKKPEPEMVRIGDFYVQKEIFAMKWGCEFRTTKGVCCHDGCWIRPNEKTRVAEKIQEIAEYLRDRPELPFWQPIRWKWAYCDSKPEDGDYHTKVINEKCIFTMTNGGCAIHAYCLDHDISWESFKFNICVTWPLDIQYWYDEKGENKAWNLWLFQDLYNEEWNHCPCIRPKVFPSFNHDGRPSVIESMKSTIINRIGQERYNQLVEFAKTYKG
jgi:hypothetical protein